MKQICLMFFFKEYECIENIITEITTNKNSANLLLNSPDVFYKNKEILFDITLSSEQKRMLMAFIDDDVIRAISDNDVKNFIDICYKKGYANKIHVNTNDIKKYFKTEADYNLFISNYGQNIEKFSGVILLPFFAGAAWVVIYLAGVLTITAFFLTVATEGVVIGTSHLKEILRESRNNPIIRLWMDNNLPLINSSDCIELANDYAQEIMSNLTCFIDNEHYNDVYNLVKNQLIGYFQYHGLTK